MKHKPPKPISRRSAEKNKARRQGILRLTIVASCAAILAIAALVILAKHGIPDAPIDPNKTATAPAES